MTEKKSKHESVFDSKLSTPPSWALKPIQAGRLKGKSDINPQWRIEAMTEKYGTCGIGWYFRNIRHTFQEGSAGEVFVFAEVEVFIKDGENWSMPIPGTGGSMIVQKEKNGLYNQDEGVKMAYTDALSVALKFLGVGSAVYAGQIDGMQAEQTKYTAIEEPIKLPENIENDMRKCSTIPELQAVYKKYDTPATRKALNLLYKDVEREITESSKPTTAQIIGDDLPDSLK